MEFKGIDQIKDEVAKEYLHPYRTWLENAKFSNDDNISVLEDSGAIDEVATRYAQQFQEQAPTDVLTTEIMVLRERNEELVEMLESRLIVFENCGMKSPKALTELITKAKEV